MAKSSVTDLQEELREKRELVSRCEAALAEEEAAAREYVQKRMAKAEAALASAKKDVEEFVAKVSEALGLPNPRLAKQRLRRARELLGQGRSPEEVATETGLAREDVEKAAAKSKSSSSGSGEGSRREGRPPLKRELVREMLAAGKTRSQIADELGMTLPAVNSQAYALKQAGLLPEVPDPDPDEDEDESSSASNSRQESPTRMPTPPPAPPAARPPVPPPLATSSGDSPDALRAEVTRQQGGQRARSAELVTSATNGHAHRVLVDRMGDGTTQSDATGHVHKVYRFVVSVAADHQHGLRVPPRQQPKA